LPKVGLHLPAWVIDLQPELRAAGSPHTRPALELVQLLIVLQHHAARSGHGAAVDHHVTGNDQAGPAVGPCLIEAHQCFGRRLIGVRHVLFHGGFGDSVLDGRTVGKYQGVEHIHGAVLNWV